MAEIMHQQRLFLEWLAMSGNIAVPDSDNGSLLYKTQTECEQTGWITLTQFGSGFFMAKLTDTGKAMVKDRRAARAPVDGQDRRRSLTS